MLNLDHLQMGRVKKAGALSHVSDLLLAGLIVAIIGLMILPLPLVVLDALVAFNIALGVMLVLMGIYINRSLQFSAFPSVLLISTLFRLALSVATTRMILLIGDAGNIINAFGEMVAGGNLVVGLVVFLNITLVQFLVIAKGAERVAEVGARFTLDAMPGKQMSIDSDLRSGLIDKTEAREKRRELELESKLHGSMDGAMKFVKGDAIAGIVIIIINLLGGLTIGIFQLGMPASAAMSKYSILTIGDGLVAQIPALLGAMSAGLIVTRVTDGDEDKNLGDSIQKQFSAIPRVLLVAGGMCVLFAFVPGFPGGVFFGLGFLLMVAGGMLVPAIRSRFNRVSHPAFESVLKRKNRPTSQINETTDVESQHAVPLLLELPAILAADGADERYRERIDALMNHLYTSSGVPLPRVRFHWHDHNENYWCLHAYEVPIAKGVLLQKEFIDELEQHCSDALRRHYMLFLGLQETSVMLSQASNESPDVVKEVLRAIPMQNIAAILRKLVEEDVPIRNLRGILEALVQASVHEKDVSNLAEYARMALCRQICHRYAPDGVLGVVALDVKLEEEFVQKIHASQGSQQFSLEPRLAQSVVDSFATAIEQTGAQAIVAPVALRRHLRGLTAERCFDIPVLSYAELPKTIQMNILARVNPTSRKPLPEVAA